MNKKIATLFLICALMCICVLSVSAAATPAVSGTADTSSTKDTVTVQLEMSDNPGLAAWKIELNWDPAVLELNPESITLAEPFADGMFVVNDEAAGKLTLVWANTGDVAADGNLVELTFDVADGAANGAYNIDISTAGTRNESGDKVSVTTTDITVVLGEEESPIKPEEGDAPNVPEQNPGGETNTDPSPVVVNPFTDVESSAYYYSPVLWAVQNNITAGTSATTFSPNASCTRAQMVTFLWRSAGSPKPASGSNRFTDITKGTYYYDAVLWALEQGITSGTSATTFSPDDTVTRGQVVTFLWRMGGKAETSQNNKFHDVSSSAYYATPVSWAVINGITQGTSAATFSPDSPCSRSQIVTFLYRFYNA